MHSSLPCEKCKSNPGQPYIFYYGKKISETSQRVGANTR